MASIVDGLFAGRSGIQGHGQAISVIADNIANSNTTGYKSSRADFTSVLAGAISGSAVGSVSVGSGSAVGQVKQIFNQGTFETTGRSLDIAIQGNGFFILQDSAGQRFFTRAGNLQTDRDGFLLDQNGFQVQGFATGGSGSLQALNVNERTLSTVDSTVVSITGNLDASSAAAPTIPIPDGSTAAALAAGYSYATTVDVFDSLGAQHTITYAFFKTGVANQWTVAAYADGADVSGGTAGNVELLGTSNLVFNSSGQLTSGGSFPFAPAVTWNNGSTAQIITSDVTGFSQFSSPNTVSSVAQDGTGGGSIVSFNIDSQGNLSALLDNGQRADIGTIALASFSNPEGLARRTGTILVETNGSGEPVIGTPGTGSFGALQSEALELSTSDLAADFIKLISLQRGFQGSSRMITSINDLLQEIVNLAR